MDARKIIEQRFKTHFGDAGETELRDFEHGESDWYDVMRDIAEFAQSQSDRIRELEGRLRSSTDALIDAEAFTGRNYRRTIQSNEQALRKTEKEPLYPATEESKQAHIRAMKAQTEKE